MSSRSCRVRVIGTTTLLRPLVKIRRRTAPARDVRIRVDELVGRELVDRARLRLALPVGERSRNDVIRDRLLRLVDGIRAEHRDTAAHDVRVLLGRARESVVRSDLRQVARDVNLREAAVRRENQHALRRLAEGERNLPVRRPHLGDDEVPGADELVLQVLCRGGLRQRECKRSERDSNELHVVLLLFRSVAARAAAAKRMVFTRSSRSASCAASYRGAPDRDSREYLTQTVVPLGVCWNEWCDSGVNSLTGRGLATCSARV